jgi:hypothetical protein
VTRGGRELHHLHVAPLGPTPDAWDHDEMSDGDVPLWTFSLFWPPRRGVRRRVPGRGRAAHAVGQQSSLLGMSVVAVVSLVVLGVAVHRSVDVPAVPGAPIAVGTE